MSTCYSVIIRVRYSTYHFDMWQEPAAGVMYVPDCDSKNGRLKGSGRVQTEWALVGIKGTYLAL